jgi:HK97 family phage portal protein
MRKTGDDSREKATDHPLYSLVKHEPNAEDTAQTFYSRLIRHILRGNAFILPVGKKMIGSRTIYSGLYLLEPRSVTVDRTKSGYKQYKHVSSGKIYRDGEILHIPGAGYDGLKGYSPLEFAKSTLEITQAMDDYAARGFSQRISSRTVIDIKDMYSEATNEDIKEIAKYLENNYSGEDNEGKPLILFDGMTVSSLEATDNRSAQLLENRQYQNRLIAQIYAVPLSLIGEGDNKYNSNEDQNTYFLQYTLLPWIRLIEQYLGKLIDPAERENLYIEFDVNGLLRGDMKTRYETYVKAIGSGMLSPNEARRMENKQSIPDSAGDSYFMPANLMPLREDVLSAYMAKARAEAQKLQDEDAPGIGDDKK